MATTADSNKRINLAAPLISVRRHGGASAYDTAVPSYKPGAADTSGARPPGHAGTVPFWWENRPGAHHPKSVRTRRRRPPPPAMASKETQKMTAAIPVVARVEEQRCSDARSRDELSCVTVNCSATGTTAPPGSRGGAMMDRFLPAAHAVAVASPLTTFRKAASVREPPKRAGDGDDRSPPPVRSQQPLQHVPANHLQFLCTRDQNEKDDDAESDVHSTHGFANKRCGMLPTRLVKSTLLLLNQTPAMRRSRAGRREEGRSVVPDGGRSQGHMNPLLRRSWNGRQQQHTVEDDPGTLSWEELYIRSLLRSARGSLMGPAAAMASELDKTVRELYRRRGGEIVQPKASHLGLLLVLDRSNDDDETALLLPRAKSSPNAAGNKVANNAGGYGYPLLLEGKDAEPGREIVLSPRAALPLPLPKSPSESWLSHALPSVSNRPPATSFLGLHLQAKKHASTALVLH